MKTRHALFVFTGLLLALNPLAGCHDDDDDGGGNTVGQSCATAEQCYPDIDHEDLSGDVVCLDRVENGYCTHHCNTDSDCCAVPFECSGDRSVVCAPFESMSGKYCSLSCEGIEDSDLYCQTWAHPDFICRSTGGGSENRKVCVP